MAEERVESTPAISNPNQDGGQTALDRARAVSEPTPRQSEVLSIFLRLRLSEGLISDRFTPLRRTKLHQTFSGRDLVSWLVADATAFDRDSAKALAQEMMTLGLIAEVDRDKGTLLMTAVPLAEIQSEEREHRNAEAPESGNQSEAFRGFVDDDTLYRCVCDDGPARHRAVMEGSVEVWQPAKGLSPAQWRPVWLVLLPDRMACFPERQCEISEATSLFSLKDIEVEAVLSSSNCLHISSRSTGLLMRFDNTQTMMAWKHLLHMMKDQMIDKVGGDREHSSIATSADNTGDQSTVGASLEGAVAQATRARSESFQHMGTVEATGWLEKRSDYLFQWRKRYFVLQDSFLSCYYTDQGGDDVFPAHIYALASARVSCTSDLTFTLETCENVVALRAESVSKRNTWIAMLHNVVEGIKQRQQQDDSVSPVKTFQGVRASVISGRARASTTTAFVMAHKDGHYQGWVDVEICGEFQRRWVVVQNRCLSMYTHAPTSSRTQALEVVLLKGALVESNAEEMAAKHGSECAIELHVHGSRVIVLRVADKSQHEDWVYILSEAMAIGLDQNPRQSTVLVEQEAIAAIGRKVSKNRLSAGGSDGGKENDTGSSFFGGLLRFIKSSFFSRPASKSNEEADLEPPYPRTLEEYKLEMVVGRGSFGQVFKASFPGGSRCVAVKILHKYRVVAAKQARYILAEKDVMGLLAHPFVLRMRCTFQTDTKLFVVLEYAPGGDLRYRLGRAGGSFAESMVRFIAAELFLALEYLHSKGVIHRDIKTENVLLDAEGHCMLGDFGLAIAGRDGKPPRSRSFVGTPDYLAPEIVNKEEYGSCVDWWAFGVLIYELLTGDTPFSGANPDVVYHRIKSERVSVSMRFSVGTRQILEQLLEPDTLVRVGCSRASVVGLRKAAFFRGVNWERFEARRIKSPLRRLIDGLDLHNFDPEYSILAKPVDSIAEELEDPSCEDARLLADQFDWPRASVAADPS